VRPIARFRHMMPVTVKIAPRTGVDAYGKPSYGTPVPYQAKIFYIRQMVTDVMRSTTQQIVHPNKVMHLDSADAILPTAQVTLTTGDAGSTENWAVHPLIKGVERLYDEKGPHSSLIYIE